MARVLLCVPTFENIYPDTFKSLWDMDKGDHQVDFEFIRGYDCATARNNCVQRMLDGGYDYLMMVDNDVTVPRDALLNLMEHGKQVVSGYYAHRNKDNPGNSTTNLCKMGEFNYTKQYTGEELRELLAQGKVLIRIHGGGMGCILIRRDVIELLKFPWYDWVNYLNGTMLSEDLFFCERCKTAKVKLYADTRVACGHMFRYIHEV